MKNLSLRLSLIFFGIILALTACEVGLRVFRPQLVYSRLPHEGPDCFLSDPVLFIKHKPNSICHRKTKEYDVYAKINNLGFRGKNVDLKSPRGKRIVFLGDSYTFGHGVADDENYPVKVESILKNHRLGIEAVNAAVEGTGLTRSYLFLKNEAKKMNPEIAVVGFFLGNDLSDLNEFEGIRLDELGLPEKIKNSRIQVDPTGRVLQASVLTRYKLIFFRESYLFILLAEIFRGKPNFYNEVAVNGTPCLLLPSCKQIDPEIEKAQKVFEGMKYLSQKNNFKLLVVLIPWEYQLPPHITELSNLGAIIRNPTNRQYLGNRFAKFLKDKSIEYIDLLDAFEAYPGSEQVFYPQDRHWTKTGHWIAAEALLPKISEMLK